MRQVTLAIVIAFAGVGGTALASPFEPATIPDQIQAVGHLDVDLLRKTQIFAAAGGEDAVNAALDEAPPEFRPIARTLARSLRGVSFWRGGDEHGAVHLETRDSAAVGKLLRKLPGKPARVVDGVVTYAMDGQHHDGFCAAVGDTLVLADSTESLERSIRVLNGKGSNLAGSSKLPLSTRQGVFVFITVGDDLLGAIQKSAHAKVLQLGVKSLVIDVGESAGVVTATARGDMRSADAVNKAKSILDGLRALGSMSNDPRASALLDGVTITASGLALEVVARLPVADLAKLIQSHH